MTRDAWPVFVEPRRLCAYRVPITGKRCGAHVVIREGEWWCAVCSAPRSLASTTEVLGASPKKRRRE